MGRQRSPYCTLASLHKDGPSVGKFSLTKGDIERAYFRGTKTNRLTTYDNGPAGFFITGTYFHFIEIGAGKTRNYNDRTLVSQCGTFVTVKFQIFQWFIFDNIGSLSRHPHNSVIGFIIFLLSTLDSGEWRRRWAFRQADHVALVPLSTLQTATKDLQA